MALKTFFFNRALFEKNLRRFFPFAICYGLIFFVMTAVVQVLNYSSLQEYAYDDSAIVYELARYAGSQAPVILAIVIPLAAILAAMLMYNYLFSDVAANALHALPVRREAQFGSVFLAGMTLLLIPVVISEGVLILFSVGIGAGELAILYLKLMGVFAAGTFVMYSIAGLCAMLSANLFMLPVLYVILNFVSLWIGVLINLLREIFLAGLEEFSIPRVLQIFCPVYELANSGTEMSYIDSSEIQYAGTSEWAFSVHGKVFLAYILAAVVLLVLAGWFYRKRAVECAGDMLSFRCLSWPLEALLATGTGVAIAGLFAMIINVTEIGVIPLFLVGSVIGFFGAGMILRRRFFVFRERWKGFAVYGALSLVVLLGAFFDVMGLETRVPKAEKVAGVIVDSAQEEVLSDPTLIRDTIALHSRLVEDLDALTAERNVVTVEWGDYDSTWEIREIRLEYVMKSGRSVVRTYDLPQTSEDLYDESSLLYQYYTLVNSPAVVKDFYSMGTDFASEDLVGMEYVNYTHENGYNSYYDFSAEDLQNLIQALTADIEAGHVLSRMSSLQGDKMNEYFYDYNTMYEQELLIIVRRSDGGTQSRYLQLRESMTYTIDVLADMGLISEESPLTVPGADSGSLD